jgi:hypothetical protein
MKATELRIGNWVDQPNEGVAKVTSILNNLQIRTETGYVDKYCKSIPLTEEWLLKFGFKINRQTKEDNNIWRCNWTEGYFEVEQIIGFFLWDNHCYGTEIKYVHQLQNLYFALTGEELDIK